MSFDLPPSEFDTTFTEFPVCPHCGADIREPHELFIGAGGSPRSVKWDCEKCGNTYWIEEHVEVTYTTSKEEER